MTQEPSQIIRKALDVLYANGVRFYSGYAGNGCFDLSPEECLDFLAGEDQAWARRLGVSLEQYRAFKAHVEARFRCTGQNRKGAQCRNSSLLRDHYHDEDAVRDFTPGFHDRCEHHIAQEYRHQPAT